MSTKVGSIHYDLDLDTKNFDKAASSISDKAKQIGNTMQNIGKTMTVGFTLPIIAAMGVSIKKASDLSETINKVEVAFGSSADRIKAWGKTTIDNIGLAGSSAMESAALFGDMGTSMGLSQSNAADMSMSMTNLAGDLASFKNIGVDQATTALAGVFTGETESLKRLGVVMTQVQLEEFALAKGIKKKYTEMTQAEKVLLRYNFVMDKTKNAQGDFARTSQGTANQIRITQERFKELSEQIGAKLLPVANKLLTWLQQAIEWFQKLENSVQKKIFIFIALVAVLGPLLIVIGALVTAIAAIGTTGLIVITVVGSLAGALVYLQNRFGAVTKAVSWLKETSAVLWSYFTTNILPILQVVAGFILGQLRSAWDSIYASIKQIIEILRPYQSQLLFLAQVLGVILVAAIALPIASFIALVAVSSVVIRVVAQLISWFFSFGRAVSETQQRVWHFVWSIGQSIISVFAGAGAWLINSGKAIMDGLVTGIRSKAEEVVNSVKNVVKKARDYLPFSPAKKGPFSGKGWTLYSGQSMMEGLASGIKQKTNLPVDAMNDAMNNVNNNQSTNVYGNINIGNNADSNSFFKRLNIDQDRLSNGLSALENSGV